MPTTPYLGFPYPSGTDSPAGASQIQALAQAVEDDMMVDYIICDKTAEQAQTPATAPSYTGMTFTKRAGNLALTPSTFGFVALHNGMHLITLNLRLGRNQTTEYTINCRKNAGGSSSGGTTVLSSWFGLPTATSGQSSVHPVLWLPMDIGDTFELFIQMNAAGGSPTVMGSIGALTAARVPGFPGF